MPRSSRRRTASTGRLSHVGRDGAARMVDVSRKPVTAREAVARGRIRIVMRNPAGSGLHPLPLAHVDVVLRPRRDGFLIEASVRTDARTGAEMEALHAVAVAALTVYDMVKAADKAMTIGEIRLVRKSGGRSGEYRAR